MPSAKRRMTFLVLAMLMVSLTRTGGVFGQISDGPLQAASSILFYNDVCELQAWDISKEVSRAIENFGRVLTIGEWAGYYPCIGCGSYSADTWCNGGIPQLANLTANAEKLWSDVQTVFGVNSSFDGHVVFDFETWHPVWNLTTEKYRNASRLYAAFRHPDLSHDAFEIERIAMEEYQNASLTFFEVSVVTALQILPNLKSVGFYGFPSVFGYWVNVTLAQWFNDNVLSSLWRVVSGFHPSLYMPYKSNVDVPLARNQQYVDQVLQENARLRHRLRNRFNQEVLVMPYTWYRYHPGEPHGMELLDDLDTDLEFRYPLNRTGGMAAAALIIWGGASGCSNTTAIDEIQQYFLGHNETFGGGGPKSIGESQRRRVLPSAGSWDRRRSSRGTSQIFSDAAVNAATPWIPPSWHSCGL